MTVEPRSRADDDDPSGLEQAAFRPAREDPLLQRALPVSADVARYGPRAGRRDLAAGLTVAALAVPSAMAYAALAGVAPSTVCTRCCFRASPTRCWAPHGR